VASSTPRFDWFIALLGSAPPPIQRTIYRELRKRQMRSVDPRAVQEKFGDDYLVNSHTFVMGIDQRLTAAIAKRFRGRAVLETCTGAGFTTIALARVAGHVITVEVEPSHQRQAEANVSRAGVGHSVTFVTGDVLNPGVLARLPRFDSAFLDPDWAVTGPDHVYRFRDSNTRPPADRLLQTVLAKTPDVALVLSTEVDVHELEGLPEHERQRLFLGESVALDCLYFGGLAEKRGVTTLHV
jgi:16S rRNA G966 N2-methylase RsmD